MDLSKEVVLVTGADGFIGSHLVEELVARGIKTRAMVLYNSFNFHGWLDSLPQQTKDKVEFISGDIRDEALLNKAFKDVTVCFHLAALISIPFSYEAPALYLQTNIQGTLNILQAARSSNIKKLIVTSTSEVYGSAQCVPITETHPLQAQSPYSASKIAADALAMSYFHSFGLPVTIARPFNTFGPRQSARAVIPTIITQILQDTNKLNLGSLHPTRDFCYVKDTVSGLLAIAEANGSNGEAINIGSGFEISIGDTLDEIAEIIGKKPIVANDQQRVRPEGSEVLRLLASTEKIKRLTKWQPKYQGRPGFRRGLEETIDWFRANKSLSGYKPEQYAV